MAGSTMGIGTSGLLTAQRQLATASQNISNVNTDGYSRQRSEQAARLPQFTGNGYVGTGVSVQNTVRLANEFLEEQIRISNSQFGQYDSFNRLSKQIDNILANPDSGLTPTLEGFFSALQEANDNPSSTPSRQVLLTEAKTMTERFKLLDDRFIQLNNQVNQDLNDVTQEVSDLARSIANINVNIVQKTGAGQGSLPNDLMDQREVMIKTIAEKIDVKVIYQDDGAANIFIGSGQALVIGSTSATLLTRKNLYNAQDLDVILKQGAGVTDVTSSITGGELQGTLDFKNSVLEPSRRSLGRISLALSEEMNAQNTLGMTLQNTGSGFKMGGDFFTDLSGPISALPNTNNTGSAVLFNITDSRVLTTSDYKLDYDGTNYDLTRLSDNTVFSSTSIANLNAIIDPAGPPYTTGTTPQGFRIQEIPLPVLAVNDSYILRPTFEASSNIDLAVNNVLDLALAGPIISGERTDSFGGAINAGSGSISLPKLGELSSIPMTGSTINDFQIVLSYSNSNLAGNPGFDVVALRPAPPGTLFPDFSIDFDPNSDAGGVSFTLDGTTYPQFGDISFTLSGTPAVGDSFEILRNTAPYDDNRNGLLLAKLQTEKTLENASTDFQAGYAMIVSDVGTNIVIRG
ncbi:flagellar hook-associated protein FlgK [sulfur-oxidizing endosymbiont of Gigantopelta aegis]|uniref:flagellar hook-associated protein FlgK n=1 Tax=sulfur-oxidizing endosymbiont of Gigantopelta aegis TaxID=2794934 RepID=UPI0018DC811C|nr:flagellar hook-associated protein FlgK [sulfur-oxidizing endosymbiont of Gigantopelta aegis]